MHSSTFQSLLVLLPLLITGSVALPDNIFGKREALIEERQGGQLAQGTTSATTSAPTGILTGVTGDRHASGNHDGPACMSEGGWQACMSSWCASGGASATAGGEATPTTGGLGGTETTPTSGSNGRMGRRQAASAPATGEAPTETGGPGGHPGGHGPGYVFP